MDSFQTFSEYFKQRLAETTPTVGATPQPTPMAKLSPQQMQARMTVGKLGADVIKTKSGAPPGGVGVALQQGAAQALQRGVDPAAVADLFPAMNSKVVPGQPAMNMKKGMKKRMPKK
jgi:hypothetical protein